MATKKHTKPEATGEACPVEAIALRKAALWEAYEATEQKDNNMEECQQSTL
jgi:hypothetical protein